MKSKRMFTLAIAVCICLVALASIASAQPPSPSAVASMEGASWTAVGGAYHLTSLAWPETIAGTKTNVVTNGGRYHLLGPALRGNGCCCNFLPCVLGDS